MRRYNPKELEPKWQKIWADTDLYKVDMSRTADKFYTIPMLPYPSGDLHIGHWYNYVGADVIARWRRMLGQNVLSTLGFDAFGLPAENAAIKRGIQPAKWTRSNIESMKDQIAKIGASYDWGHSLATCDPSYYKWNQWLFLKLYEKGLAYRKKALVNWCPKDQTVLANEQVITDANVCERCGTPVIQKELEQWFYKITEYADRLLDDLDNVDWPDRVKTMQENWIGRSRGARIDFETRAGALTVFTTRPDTIFGATYMVIAPEHPLLEKLTTADHKDKVKNYLNEAKRKTELERQAGEKEKTGVFTGSFAVNPATKEKIPIWVADYVLMNYGTGAIMAVPAHDERDYDFAAAHSLPLKPVIVEDFGHPLPDEEYVEGAVVIAYDLQTGKYMALDKWAGGVGLAGGGRNANESYADCARRELAEETGISKVKDWLKLGEGVYSHYFNNLKKVNKRSYGEGFLAIVDGAETGDTSHEAHETFEPAWLTMTDIRQGLEKLRASKGGGGVDHWFEMCDRAEVAVATYKRGEVYQQQPYSGEGVLINSGKYDGQSTSVAREKITKELGQEQTNYRLRDWLISRQRYWGTPIPIIYCDKCGIQPVPETELPVILPEDVEFTPAGRNPLLDRPDFVKAKCPTCGGEAERETDTMDTFMDSSWYFLRYIDNKNDAEIFDTELINKWGPVDHYLGGIEHAILHLMYARFMVKFLHDYYGLSFEEPFKRLTNQGIILGPDGQKMSKSRGNVVSPDEQVTSYGADSLRLYMLFMGPYDQGGPYSLSGIAGTRRFLDRAWTLLGEYLQAEEQPRPDLEETAILAATHRAIKTVSADIESLNFNTAIAAQMSLVNELYKLKADRPISKTPAWNFALSTLIQLLAPLSPHISEEMWQLLGHDSSVHVSNWPKWDADLVKQDLITIAVQVNGKVRAELLVSPDTAADEVIALAKKDPAVEKHLAGKATKKEIYIPGRLVSLAV